MLHRVSYSHSISLAHFLAGIDPIVHFQLGPFQVKEVPGKALLSIEGKIGSYQEPAPVSVAWPALDPEHPALHDHARHDGPLGDPRLIEPRAFRVGPPCELDALHVVARSKSITLGTARSFASSIQICGPT